ncbi:Dual-specificity kinase, spindle pole body (SPB) duplication and spindle checkpoint function [Coemansia aciculifera]|nr:Dual-specificity kinase, spindle pole body (SPB) duplication and spindle checkpoint function [Coemansia aciculifera]
MSLYNNSYGSSGLGSQQGSRSSRAPYSSLASSKAVAATKPLELSMDDFDDIDKMSDMEHMDFEKTSRTPETRSRVGGRDPAVEDQNGVAFHSRRAARSHSYDEQAFMVTPSTEGILGRLNAGGRGYERQTPGYDSGSHSTLLPADGRSLLSPEHRYGSALELSQESEYMTKNITPASYRASQRSSDSMAKVRFSSEIQSEQAADMTAVRATRDSTGYLAEQPTSNEYAMAETPALKPPQHPVQGSTVTSRWKRRGRFGLAKPKRNDHGLPSEDSTHDGEGDSMGFGSNSPPKSLEFLGESSGSIDHKPFSSRHTQSPPRSHLSGLGSLGSENSQRHSFASMDEPAPEFENTFHTARPRYSSKSPPDVSSGGPADTARVPYESSAQNRSMDISDVSMTSNPRSRPHSPDVDSAIKTPASTGSLSRTSFSEHSGSHGKRTAELRQAEGGGSDAKEYAPSDMARRRALSPLIGRVRPLGSSVGSASNESLGQRAELGTSPKMQPKRGSPNSQGHGLVRASTASALEKRSSAHGDSAMEISSRFQQYEIRMKEASPQYRSPRERQRGLGGLVRSADVSMGSADSSRAEDGEHYRVDQHPPSEPKSSSRRINSASSSARMSDKPAVPAYDGRPEHHSISNASPRLSARRVAAAATDNNFEALRRGGTPAVTDENVPNGVRGSAKSTNGQSEDRNRSPYLSPAVVEKPALQAQYAEALSQVAQQRKPAVSFSQPALTPPQQVAQSQSRTNSQPKATPQTTPQDQQQQQAVQGGIATDPKRTLVVNGRSYQKISITGRGGSSKVYKAMSPKHEIFAIKRVSFSRADMQAIEGYINEIILLRKFEGNPYIIQLYDAEINKERGLIHMVMEFGETDLASVLKRQGDRPLGMNTIRLYWEQMLKAVQIIHDERVVHADLKPANYLLVRGSLKLIDFGIAKSIGNDTTNIHRENQVGTVNYMSPEAIKETNTEGGARLMKLGRASDIWSLGIILYQMCYGRTPFAQLALFKKLASIPDPSFAIPYPQYMAGCLQVGTENDPNADIGPTFSDGSAKVKVPSDLLQVMKACLHRDPNKRITIPQLLVDPLLCPISMEHALPPAMSQLLTLLKASPHVLDQWDISELQNEKILSSLVKLNETLLELNQKIEEINEMNSDLVAFSNIWNHYQRNANLYLTSTNSLEPAAVKR